MREVQLSTNHCRRFGPSLLVGLGIMLAGSALAQPVDAAAGNNHLKRSEIENIRNNIVANWSRPADMTGAQDVHVQIQFKLDRDGQFIGEPKVTMTGGPKETQKAVAASALRAVLKSAPFKNLPIDQYDDWKEVSINFSASDPAH